jgi:dTMP kinase
MILVLEGLDGCGKSTVMDALAERMNASTLVFPHDDSVTGKVIREYLRQEWHATNAHAEALAFQALQTVNRLECFPILKHYEDNLKADLILCRYWQSGWVYGQMDGLDPVFLEHIHQPMPKPYLNVLLQVPPDVAWRRVQQRKGVTELYETPHKIEEAADLYNALWASRAGDAQWIIIDATRPLAEVVDEICAEAKCRWLYVVPSNPAKEVQG